MRKCLRCGVEMVENLAVMTTTESSEVDVRERGMFKFPLAKIKCAVCPECGYTETYVDNTERIKALVKGQD